MDRSADLGARRVTSELLRRFVRFRGRRRQRTLDDLLAVLDLVTVVVGSGATTRRALEVVVERGPATVARATVEALDRGRAGWSLRQILLAWPDHAGEAYRPLAAALLSAERDGAPIGLVLARLADEARSVRRRRDEEQARRLSVQLLFPLVVCSLPAVIVGVIVPLVVASIDRL